MTIDHLYKRETLRSMFRQRQPPYEDTSVANRNLDQYLTEGWRVLKRGTNRSRIRRDKPLYQHIEDRIWVILYNMGFTRLSGETGAILESPGENGIIVRNQLDALAIDDEAAIIVECKTANAPKGRPDLQKDLALLQQHRNTVSRALHEEAPRAERIKVGTVMVLWDILATEADVQRAKDARTLLLDATALEYYEKLVEHTGTAARYQFLAEVFPDQDITGLALTVPAVEAKIGKSVAYMFTISPAHLLKIAFVAHRGRGEYSELGAYQRMVKRSRLQAIRKYIDEGGIFPTNIIINFSNSNKRSGPRFEQAAQAQGSPDGIKLGWLHLPSRYQAAWIIDGQHRLLAYSGSANPESAFLCVTAFVGLDIEEQTELFIRINSEQKKVSGNLLTELCATLYRDSKNYDERVFSIASQAVQDLGLRRISPLYKRIKMENEEGTFIKCITLQAVTRELRKEGFYISRRLHGEPVEFGPLWASKSDVTLKRTKNVLDGWFGAIRAKSQSIWELGKAPGGFISMNDGIVVSLEVLRSVFEHLNLHGKLCGRLPDDELVEAIRPYGEAVGEYFHRMTPTELDEARKRRGIQGQTYNLRRVQEAIRNIYPDFDPPELANWLTTRADQKMAEAYQIAASIEMRIQNKVVSMLSAHFGSDRSQWWAQVPREVRVEASKRREEDDRSRGEEEKYLNFIDYRKIMLAHWQDVFQSTFAYGDQGNKEKRTEWLVRLNNTRNKVMHASAGGLSVDDFDYLQGLV